MKHLDPNRARLAVLHHSAHEPKPSSTAHAEMLRIKKWHLDRNFSDIGYHFVVKGNSYVSGRSLLYRGAHCLDWNQFSIGICVCGDLTKRSPTPTEISSVLAAIAEAEYEFGHKLLAVGHNQLGNTLCPGSELVYMVNKLNDIVNGSVV